MKRPVIGITCGDFSPGAAAAGPLAKPRAASFLPSEVVNAVVQAGGLPVILPTLPPDETMHDRCDALLLPGGPDPDPLWFGEEPLPGTGRISPQRDAWELFLCKWYLKERLPILGLCRGAQILNIALGGDIYQDLDSQYEGVLKHFQDAPDEYPTHTIRIEPGSLLHRCMGATSIVVNSWHHQAIRKLGDNVRATATALDGVIEAIEVQNQPYAVGVQWHPESMAGAGDERQQALMKSFIDAARLRGS